MFKEYGSSIFFYWWWSVLVCWGGCFVLLVWFDFVSETGSLFTPDWPQTLNNPPASVSQVLGLQACAINVQP